MLDSGYFGDRTKLQRSCQVTYTIEQYLNLLSTLRKIDPEVKEPFFTELKECLQKLGDSVELSFLSAVHIAQKK